MKLTDKQITVFRGISLGAAVFTLAVALIMLFSVIQLKEINPVNNPTLAAVKEKFDSDPENKDLAEQVRTMDLMARRAYFSSRWQVETGTWLLLAGAVVFFALQSLVSGSEKPAKALYPGRPDIIAERKNYRRYLLIAGGSVTLLAIVSSFILRKDLPARGRKFSQGQVAETPGGQPAASTLPDPVNWPFFRGEGSHGIAGGEGYPVTWDGPSGKNIKWKIAVPEAGKNSPVIWKDKLFFTGSENKTLNVFCVGKNDGKIIWTGSANDFQGASAEVPESDAEAGMAVPTAAVNENYICAIFGNGNLVCFNHDGKLQWGKNVGIPKVTYGFSASLLIYKNILIVQFDSQDRITVSGFDLKSGDKKWETARTGRPVNSSPVLATFDNQPQVLINGNPNVSAYNPQTGKELWSQPGVSGDVAPSLAVNSRLVYAVTDYYKIIAMKPGTTAAAVWEDNTFTPDVSSPVANDQFLFVATGNGDAACYNAEKGDTLWSHYFKDPIYPSPIIAGGNVYFLDRSGVMHIVKAGPKFELVGEASLGEKTDATPAFSEKKIYIRGKENLYCISEK